MLFQAVLKDMAYSFSPLTISITYKNFPLSDTSFLYEERMAGVAIHPPSPLLADNKKQEITFTFTS